MAWKDCPVCRGRGETVEDAPYMHGGIIMPGHKFVPCPVCAKIDPLEAERDKLAGMVANYEDGITWQTTCLNCAELMNDNYNQYVELNKADKRVAELEKEAANLQQERDTYYDRARLAICYLVDAYVISLSRAGELWGGSFREKHNDHCRTEDRMPAPTDQRIAELEALLEDPPGCGYMPTYPHVPRCPIVAAYRALKKEG